jgi:excisionase family DNA binding protein
MRTDEKRDALRTVGEAADELRCSRASIYRAIDRGELEAWRLGESGQLRIPASSVDAFLVPVDARRRHAKQKLRMR